MAGMTLSADGTDGKNWGGVIVFDVWINRSYHRQQY